MIIIDNPYYPGWFLLINPAYCLPLSISLFLDHCSGVAPWIIPILSDGYPFLSLGFTLGYLVTLCQLKISTSSVFMHYMNLYDISIRS